MEGGAMTVRVSVAQERRIAAMPKATATQARRWRGRAGRGRGMGSGSPGMIGFISLLETAALVSGLPAVVAFERCAAQAFIPMPISSLRRMTAGSIGWEISA
jgi:hypothetical protein